MKKDEEKYMEYALKLTGKVQELLSDEDGDFHISLEDLEGEGNLTAFMHALANAMPCRIYNHLTGDSKNTLEFNHLANHLCFQFSNKVD